MEQEIIIGVAKWLKAKEFPDPNEPYHEVVRFRLRLISQVPAILPGYGGASAQIQCIKHNLFSGWELE